MTSLFQPIYDLLKDQSNLQEIDFVNCDGGIPNSNVVKKRLGMRTLLILDDLMVHVGLATTDNTASSNQ